MKESNHCTLRALTRLPACLHLNVFLSSLNRYLLPRKERKYSHRFAKAANGADDKFCKGSQQLDLTGSLSAPAAQSNTLTGNLVKEWTMELNFTILYSVKLFDVLLR